MRREIQNNIEEGRCLHSPSYSETIGFVYLATFQVDYDLESRFLIAILLYKRPPTDTVD